MTIKDKMELQELQNQVENAFMLAFYNGVRGAQTWHASPRKYMNSGKNRLRNVRVCGRRQYLLS